MNDFDKAVELAKQGLFPEAKAQFELLLASDPRNPDILYNLGMCFTELGQPDKAVVALRKSIEYKLGHANGYVALGVAQIKLHQDKEAEENLKKALEIEPNNAYAHRNLGALYGRRGDLELSLASLQKAFAANRLDPLTVYGLASTYQQRKEYEKADELYQTLLAMDAPSNVKSLAKNGRREIAGINLKSKGLRMDAVMYMMSALKMFGKAPRERVQEITLEIAMKGLAGLEINNPTKKYTLRTMPGEFTGLHLISYMYVGFKQLSPERDIGIDLSKEYALAMSMSQKGQAE